MHKSTLLFFLLSFALIISTKIYSISSAQQCYAEQSARQEQEEKADDIETEKKERTGEEKLIHPKAYTPIYAFSFGNSQCLVLLSEPNAQLLPSHHQILERPPKS